MTQHRQKIKRKHRLLYAVLLAKAEENSYNNPVAGNSRCLCWVVTSPGAWAVGCSRTLRPAATIVFSTPIVARPVGKSNKKIRLFSGPPTLGGAPLAALRLTPHTR